MSPNTPLTQYFNLTPTWRVRIRTFQNDIFHRLMFQNSVCLPVPTCFRVYLTHFSYATCQTHPEVNAFFCCCACRHSSFVKGVLDVVTRRGSWYGGTENWLFEILDSSVTCRLFVLRCLILPATNTRRKILCLLGRLMFPCVLHERPRSAQMTPSPFMYWHSF